MPAGALCHRGDAGCVAVVVQSLLEAAWDAAPGAVVGLRVEIAPGETRIRVVPPNGAGSGGAVEAPPLAELIAQQIGGRLDGEASGGGMRLTIPSRRLPAA